MAHEPFSRMAASTAARNRDENAGAAASESKGLNSVARQPAAFLLPLAGSRRPRSAGRAWSVWQSFHAFGNDLAELHHLLAQSRVFYDFAMDAIAVGTELFP
jgi:hypothetical protein